MKKVLMRHKLTITKIYNWSGDCYGIFDSHKDELMVVIKKVPKELKITKYQLAKEVRNSIENIGR